jgi:hypothetical protein
VAAGLSVAPVDGRGEGLGDVGRRQVG